MPFMADHRKTVEVYFIANSGISDHLYVSQTVVLKMVTVQERARCVGWLFETKLVTQTQQNYRTRFNNNLRVTKQ
jgi:hypothetical protein